MGVECGLVLCLLVVRLNSSWLKSKLSAPRLPNGSALGEDFARSFKRLTTSVASSALGRTTGDPAIILMAGPIGIDRMLKQFQKTGSVPETAAQPRRSE